MVTDIKNIENHILKTSWFEVYGEDGDTYMFQTRENGCVGSESASHIDVNEAKRLIKELKELYPKHVFNMEICDEWVSIYVKDYVEPNPQYKYEFIKDCDGIGFSEEFNSMDALIKRFGSWIDIDWKSAKEKIESVNSFPNNSYCGYHTSNRQTLIKRCVKGNTWGYDFFLAKSKKD